jgi:hypothetical protein
MTRAKTDEASGARGECASAVPIVNSLAVADQIMPLAKMP